MYYILVSTVVEKLHLLTSKTYWAHVEMKCAHACSHIYALSHETQKDTLQIAALILTQKFFSAHSAFVPISL